MQLERCLDDNEARSWGVIRELTVLRRCSGPLRISLAAILFTFATHAHAVPIDTLSILDIGDSDSTNDGTIFEANANPTSPSTGTGVFQPFVRIQATGSSQQTSSFTAKPSDPGNGPAQGSQNQNGSSGNPISQSGGVVQRGFNTEAKEPGINFDTKGGTWTDSITLGDVGTVTRNGTRYLEFALDANEPGRFDSIENQIDITDIQLFLGPENPLANPEAYGLGTSFDSDGVLELGSNADLIWRLDNATNGNVTVTLQASICDAPGQCGSGHGDMTLLIPVGELDLPAGFSLDDNLVFYTAYDRAGGSGSGFEEWRHGSGPPIPEPRAWLSFAAGGLIVGWATRRARR